MSHYTVAVFTDDTTDVDELLAPYNEEISVAPYISRTKQEMIDYAKRRAEIYRKDEEEGKPVYEWMRKYLDAKTDEEFYACEWCEDYKYDRDGNELSTYNPASKWDWYTVGGRWSDAFDVYGIDPEGTRVGDIKRTCNPEAYDHAIRSWELIVDEAEPQNKQEEDVVKFNFYNKEYFLERYHDKETYARCMSGFMTHSVVLPDGTWHEAGQMGWFGISHETPDDGLSWELNYIRDYIEAADPDWTMTIVDCHI